MNRFTVNKSLIIKGKDTISFVDSLISNSLKDGVPKFSYLLSPDGKVSSWFIVYQAGSEVFIFQDSDKLIQIKEFLLKYKFRTDCNLDLIDVQYSFDITTKENELLINLIEEKNEIANFLELETQFDLPSKSIIEKGLMPNEILWLESFVDYFKGCFIGQEQTSRVKYRGRPRRILKTLPDGSQVIDKITNE
jgi:folate-binding protein YgfZ